jgi:hypothetical protein
LEKLVEQQTRKSPSVIPRNEIPMSPSTRDGNLEVRPFLAHKLLGSMLPSSAVCLAWTEARPGKDVEPRSHRTPGLLIIVEGRAMLTGRLSRTVEAGDVITLPRDHEYGFTAVGPAGLHALHLAFDGDAASYTEDATTLRQLLARNEARLQIALNNSFFSLLRRCAINTDSKRSALRESLHIFSNAFEECSVSIKQHRLEEMDCDLLLSGPRATLVGRDSLLRAMSSRFRFQLLGLDNSEKTVVNLVLETGDYYLGALSMPMFEGDSVCRNVDTHGEDGVCHDALGMKMLEGLQPHAYVRLQRVLDASWDMVDTMTQRFAQLIELDEGSS